MNYLNYIHFYFIFIKSILTTYATYITISLVEDHTMSIAKMYNVYIPVIFIDFVAENVILLFYFTSGQLVVKCFLL